MGTKVKLLATMTVFLSSVACDQTTKELAVRELKGQGSIDLLGGSARLVYAENPGAFLGLGGDWPAEVRVPLFLGMAFLISAFLVWTLWRKREELGFWPQLGIATLAAGAVGNLIDRLLRDGGRVVDFMQFGVGPLQTGIFNVADVFLMAAVPWLMFVSFRQGRTERQGAQETS